VPGGLPATVRTGGWRGTLLPTLHQAPGTARPGICVAGDAVVLVSGDGDRWGLPGGRPEPGEDWTDTLGREVREEACATVTACRLLGFSRGVCVRGSQAGLVLVRALWRAEVRPDPWQPALR
jgi:ADP-ribose pyrophosphatase YjhB (NUDIX family)